MLIDGASRRQIEAYATQALIAANTIAGANVAHPRDWPTRPEDLPAISVQAPRERKSGMMAGQLEFTTTITLVVIGRLAGTEPAAVDDALDELSAQIEQALMLSADLAACVQKFESIDTQSSVTSDGKYHIGEVGVVFELSLYQAFGPSGDPLTNITGTLQPGFTPGVQPIVIQTSSTE